MKGARVWVKPDGSQRCGACVIDPVEPVRRAPKNRGRAMGSRARDPSHRRARELAVVRMERDAAELVAGPPCAGIALDGGPRVRERFVAQPGVILDVRDDGEIGTA